MCSSATPRSNQRCPKKKVDMASATQRSIVLHGALVNVVFVNIDWKATRHDTKDSRARNKKKLQDTIGSIVANMHPDILCMCEVGEAGSLMTEEPLEEVRKWCLEQWKRTATGREGAGWRSLEYKSAQAWKEAQDNLSLSVLYEKEAPYMTIYDSQKCTCRCSTILHDVYKPKVNEPRTAQHMLFQWNKDTSDIRNPEVLEIVNVHAPSGRNQRQLTDPNRRELIFNLLQRRSLEYPAITLGHKNFLIGGDMNTPPGTLTELLSQAYRLRMLKEEPVILPHQMAANVKRGDYCVLQGIRGEILPRRGAHNHDHQHDPYGIQWTIAEQVLEYSRSTTASSSTAPYTVTSSRYEAAPAPPEVPMPKPRPVPTPPEPPVPPPLSVSKQPPPVFRGCFPAPAPKYGRPESGRVVASMPKRQPVPKPPELPVPPPLPVPKEPPTVLMAPAPKSGRPESGRVMAPAAKYRHGALAPEQKSSARLDTIQENPEAAGSAADPDDSDDSGTDDDASAYDHAGKPGAAGSAANSDDSDDSGTDDDASVYDHAGKPGSAHDDDSGADGDEKTSESTPHGSDGSSDDADDDTHPPTDRAQELLYNVLNAMLDHISFKNETAEQVLREAVESQKSCMMFRSKIRSEINAIEQVFAPIFYDFGDKKKYQTEHEQWQPKCETWTASHSTSNGGSKANSVSATYIQQWRQYSTMRAFWNRTILITPLQVLSESEWKNVLKGQQEVFRQTYRYRGYMPPNNEQTRRAFLAKLRQDCGDKRIAHAIWKMGMPERSLVVDAITECTHLSSEMKERLTTDANKILSWFYDVAVHCMNQKHSERSQTTSLHEQSADWSRQGRTTSPRHDKATFTSQPWHDVKWRQEGEHMAPNKRQYNTSQHAAWQKKPREMKTVQYESWSTASTPSTASGWKATWHGHSWRDAWQQDSHRAPCWSK